MAVNNRIFGSSQVKKVMLGASLIWENWKYSAVGEDFIPIMTANSSNGVSITYNYQTNIDGLYLNKAYQMFNNSSSDFYGDTRTTDNTAEAEIVVNLPKFVKPEEMYIYFKNSQSNASMRVYVEYTFKNTVTGYTSAKQVWDLGGASGTRIQTKAFSDAYSEGFNQMIFKYGETGWWEAMQIYRFKINKGYIKGS